MTNQPIQIDYRDLEQSQMLLRFAGKAMGALIVTSLDATNSTDDDILAREAFDTAEAMVREYLTRKQGVRS